MNTLIPMNTIMNMMGTSTAMNMLISTAMNMTIRIPMIIPMVNTSILTVMAFTTMTIRIMPQIHISTNTERTDNKSGQNKKI